ncbi:unnamed protein product [Toxocara canis]|uniref:SAM-dependent methyltransferase n=1 Tax=Toxocara canis TaxID=6265 RepID=A0A183UUK6_TOXCA|nr:unnamed protein product [Toxocara canis]
MKATYPGSPQYISCFLRLRREPSHATAGRENNTTIVNTDPRIQRVVESTFSAQYDVICAEGSLSYVAYVKSFSQ